MGTSDLLEDAGISELSSAQIDLLRIAYNEALTQHQALLDEVAFILKEKIEESGIKIHAIDGRIKSIESVIGKCQRKGSGDLESLTDVVGARVVSLFRSDIERLKTIVQKNFEVVEVDDKVSAEGDVLRYLSIHFICRLPSRYSGPRYQKLKNLVFEVQVRTLCMHAWAAVSHYLDYKGDWDVPTDLKQSLSALSGLFYVADSQFEQFYAARIASQKQAIDTRANPAQQEINLDTVTAYLRNKFSDRDSSKTGASALVRQLKAAKYKSMSEVEADLERALPVFERYEEECPPSDNPRYNGVGAARLSLALASDAFNGVHLKQRGNRDIAPYRTLVPPAKAP